MKSNDEILELRKAAVEHSRNASYAFTRSYASTDEEINFKELGKFNFWFGYVSALDDVVR